VEVLISSAGSKELDSGDNRTSVMALPTSDGATL
jgi:hypothetical protein